MLPWFISSMLLIFLKKKWGGEGEVPEEGVGEMGVVSIPGWKGHNVPAVDSFPLALGSAWGHFFMFGNTVCFLVPSISVQSLRYTQVLTHVVCLHLFSAWGLALLTLKTALSTSCVTSVRLPSDWPFVSCAYTTDASVTVLCFYFHGFCCQLVHALLGMSNNPSFFNNLQDTAS